MIKTTNTSTTFQDEARTVGSGIRIIFLWIYRFLRRIILAYVALVMWLVKKVEVWINAEDKKGKRKGKRKSG